MTTHTPLAVFGGVGAGALSVTEDGGRYTFRLNPGHPECTISENQATNLPGRSWTTSIPGPHH